MNRSISLFKSIVKLCLLLFFMVMELLLLSACAVKKEVPIQKKSRSQVEHYLVDQVKDRSFPRQKRQIRVALLIPLGGSDSKAGVTMIDAITMALDKFDLEERINIIPIDCNDEDKSTDDLLEKIDKENVDIILGPMSSYRIQGVYPYSRSRDMVMIPFSNDPYLFNKELLYPVGFVLKDQIEDVLLYANNGGYHDIYMSVPKNNYGAHLEKISQECADSNGELGLKIKAIARYEDGDEEQLSEIISRIKQEAELFAHARKGDGKDRYKIAFFLPEGGEILHRVATKIGELVASEHLDVLIVGTTRWLDDQVAQIPELQGAIISGVDVERYGAMRRDFYRVFGYRPPVEATIAYDAVAMLANLISIRDQVYYQEAFLNIEPLTSQQTFEGMSKFTIDQNGLPDRDITILTLDGGRVKNLSLVM